MLQILHWSVSLCRRLRAIQTQTSPARSPLSVRGFAHSATECPKSSPEGQPNFTNPPAFGRERPKAGGFKYISLGPRICASKAQMPHSSLGRYVRNPFAHERVSCGCLFWYLFSSEDEKSTPKSQTIQPQQHPNHTQTQTIQPQQHPNHTPTPKILLIFRLDCGTLTVRKTACRRRAYGIQDF